MRASERVVMLEEAQEKIGEAINLIKKAVDNTGQIERSCKAYIIAHLEGWAEGTNPYDDTAIPRIIERISEDGVYGEDDVNDL